MTNQNPANPQGSNKAAKVLKAAQDHFDLEPCEVIEDGGQWFVKFWPMSDDDSVYFKLFGAEDEVTFLVGDLDVLEPGFEKV